MCEYVIDKDNAYAKNDKGVLMLSMGGFCVPEMVSIRVRMLLPDKLITVFSFGGYTNFDAITMNAISYMWPDFGADWSTPAGLGNSKWAKMSIHCTDGRPSAGVIQSSAANYSGYGAIMMFNLRESGQTSLMNNFASRVWGGKTVSRTTTIYAKNY